MPALKDTINTMVDQLRSFAYGSDARGARSWQRALALAGRHLSLYQLTIEPETPFARLLQAGKQICRNPMGAGAVTRSPKMTERAGSSV